MADVTMWQSFFHDAGIPPALGAKYARLFAEQRMRRSMLGDLDKATLKELGVSAIGDQMAILRHIRDHGSQPDSDDSPPSQQDVPPADSKKPPVSTRVTKNISGPTTTGGKIVNKAVDDVGKAAMHALKTAIKAPASPSSDDVPTRRGQAGAPDRHDVYMIKMPLGKTAKSRELLQKAAELKEEGLLARATSGIRKSGQAVEERTTVFGRLGTAAGPENPDAISGWGKRAMRKRAAEAVADSSAVVSSTTGSSATRTTLADSSLSSDGVKRLRMASDGGEKAMSALSRLGKMQGQGGGGKEIVQLTATKKTHRDTTDSSPQLGGALFRRAVDTHLTSSMATVTLTAVKKAPLVLRRGATIQLGRGDSPGARAISTDARNRITTAIGGRLGKKPATMEESSVFSRLG